MQWDYSTVIYYAKKEAIGHCFIDTHMRHTDGGGEYKTLKELQAIYLEYFVQHLNIKRNNTTVKNS